MSWSSLQRDARLWYEIGFWSHAEHAVHNKIMCHGSENFLDFKLPPVILFCHSETQMFIWVLLYLFCVYFCYTSYKYI